MKELVDKVLKWGLEKGIIPHSAPLAQQCKANTELYEFCDAHSQKQPMEMGDIIVTCILLGELIGIKFLNIYESLTENFDLRFIEATPLQAFMSMAKIGDSIQK
ncbi:MAG: hypothetical protein AAFO07_34145, partial [Bacteroidota bacterium]